MADIELVIKIPEEMWEKVKDGYVPLLGISKYLMNGAPLPKGHGDLKDAERLLDSFFYEYCKYGDFGYRQAKDLIESSLTIIEADGGKEDGDSN